MEKTNNAVKKFKKEKKKRKRMVKKVTKQILKNFSGELKFFIPMNIDELPGDLLVYPSPLFAIPDTITTVKELRDEINNCPENKEVLIRVLNELHSISAKSYHELCRGDETVIELYNRTHQEIENKTAMDIYNSMHQKCI